MTCAQKRLKPSRTVDCSTIAQVTKILMLAQTSVSKWGSSLLSEPENQALQISFEFSALSLVDFNVGFHDSVRDMASRGAILDSHNTLNQVPTPKSRATLPSTISQLAVIIPLSPVMTIMTLDISKYPNYVYSTPTGRPKNGKIWAHGYDIQHLKGV